MHKVCEKTNIGSKNAVIWSVKIRISLGNSPGILLLPKDSFPRNMGIVGEEKRKLLVIYAQYDQSLCLSLEYSLTVKLLTNTIWSFKA